ncbi:TetR family transcriptional regulator [Gryllotalpicola protaetiae]|uniref:TetR/AcrR family transcriptional regulator n=1 Tax=Gryllotalpicola protaetiae TaxID=2419771 RepID=A0A387BY92_9MICO|nr:TetR family transcriptional regulator [Gryllotalpicola protaetiae]AYG03311.1 TetR/AcrR family transcriptional regulator [Gryllotalpicola protaetiae]
MTTKGAQRRRTGRPVGSPPNRDAILASARREFSENGFEGTTIRKIAAGAGVDVALVYHYFTSKDQLLLESLHDARTYELTHVLDGDPARIGERLLRQALTVYDDGDALVGLIRAAGTHEEAAKALREGIGEGELIQLLNALGQPQSEVRAALIASTLVGLTTTRSIVRAGALADADHDTLVAWYAPTIQRYLTEPLPGG